MSTAAGPPERFAVLSPEGVAQAIEQILPAPRLASFDGRTVAFVWDSMFKGDTMFEILAQQLRGVAPDVRFVGHEVFGDIHADHTAVADLPDRLREWSVDAAIVGICA